MAHRPADWRTDAGLTGGLMDRLPIDELHEICLRELSRAGNLVVRAPTGSGKTTRLPLWLLDRSEEPCSRTARQVILVEPRRVAARAAARRMAQQRGTAVGGEIGYAVRFDQQQSAATRLLIVTDGILLRMLQGDPFLESVQTVVFDEFHERGLNVDLSLAMVRRIQQTVRPDLQIVVMSATLDPQPIANYLGQAAAIESQGRSYPVEIEYLSPAQLSSGSDARAGGRGALTVFGKTAQQIAALVELGVRQMLDRSRGDLLIFLPGKGEIRRCEQQLQSLAQQSQMEILPMHGELSPEEQDRVLTSGPRRRIVLATNVAETSLTIPGVTTVIDTGLVRVMQFDAERGVDQLQLQKVSRASADQRTGRAGRVREGQSLRLWTERDQQSLPERDRPEILRCDLSGAALQLIAWGESDLAGFPWFEPPQPERLRAAVQLLERLGAVRDNRITPLGEQMSQLPLPPRLALVLVAGADWGFSRELALAAALLSERDPFIERPYESGGGTGQRRQPAAATHRSLSDLVDRMIALQDFERTGATETFCGPLQPIAARQLLQARDQLVQQLRTLTVRNLLPLEGGRPRDWEQAAQRAVAIAYSDRLACRREPGSRKALLVGGRGVVLSPASAVQEPPLFVCLELQDQTAEAMVRLASGVERSWLPKSLETKTDELSFDPQRQRVVTRRVTCWDGLPLEAGQVPTRNSDDVSAVLYQHAIEEWERVFPKSDAVSQLLVRIACLSEWMPELKLPNFDLSLRQEILQELCLGRQSFEELQQAGWSDAIRGRLTPQQLVALERETPERITLPSGSRIALEYQAGQAPILAARIQELFGWKQSPRVAGGRVPVLLHLLGPNFRPQQITSDLTSFWNNTYPEVRKELKRRYPKHSWPEDPWTAAAERKPGGPRSKNR